MHSFVDMYNREVHFVKEKYLKQPSMTDLINCKVHIHDLIRGKEVNGYSVNYADDVHVTLLSKKLTRKVEC